MLQLFLLTPLLFLTYRYTGDPVWAWTGFWGYVAQILIVLASIGFAWSLRYYEMSNCIGLLWLVSAVSITIYSIAGFRIEE